MPNVVRYMLAPAPTSAIPMNAIKTTVIQLYKFHWMIMRSMVKPTVP